jgi:poly-gamma-glutamate synthesis protein (capsule biosynthesis protein)
MNIRWPYLVVVVVIVIAGSSAVLWYVFGSKNLERPARDTQNLSSYWQPAATPTTPPTDDTATFLAVGDIMLSRKVAQTISKANDPELPFRKLSSLLLSTDFNFGNLESPTSGKSTFNAGETLVFNAPPEYLQPLAQYKFKILNLANNHALDQGVSGLRTTEQALDKLAISHVGTGDSLDSAWQGRVITTNGIRIGFIGASYTSFNDGGKQTSPYIARTEDVKRLTQSITDLKTRTDFVVVTMHAGTEYTREPNQQQTDFAHAAIDAGADLIIGAHPHWVQTIEQYKNKYIFYSLGNFIFDQEWSPETKAGLAVKVSLTKPQTNNLENRITPVKLKQLELTPITLENFSTPRLATPVEAEKLLKAINQPSSKLLPE